MYLHRAHSTGNPDVLASDVVVSCVHGKYPPRTETTDPPAHLLTCSPARFRLHTVLHRRLKLLAQAGELKGGIWAGMQTVVKEEGFKGLWRGNTVNVLRMIPNKGVLHATNDLYKDMTLHLALTGTAAAAAASTVLFVVLL